MKHLATSLAIAALAVVAAAAEKKVELKDLPPAVQKAVAEQTKNAELKGLSKETEKGVTSYEIETVANGRHRDLTVDAKGNVTSVEEETQLDSIPAAAKAAIEKKVATGKITMVEAVSKGGAISFYEAQYTTKGGKKMEVAVKADGSPSKE
jgi:Na+-transporting NADH:ubiquinone oxidoreductase subunit NqrC